MTTTGLKIAATLLSGVLLLGAWAIGGGIPLTPRQLATATEEAVSNARIAARNTRRAAEATEAVAQITRNVAAQLDTSRRLLRTQLTIEGTSREGVDIARSLTARIEEIADALADLDRRLRSLSRLAAAAGGRVRTVAAAAGSLDMTLDRLRARFDDVVDESRELNRKAKAFGEVRP